MEGSKYDDYRCGILLFLSYVERKSEILHFENQSKSSSTLKSCTNFKFDQIMIWSHWSTFLVWCALVVLKRKIASMEY